jgi:hypothetical protein
LLGLTEADERRELAELYLFIVEYVKNLRRDQILVSSAMVYLHMFFKKNSLLKVSSNIYIVAASCVFLSAKVRYTPVSLKKAVQVYFDIEKRRNPTLMMKTSLTQERELHYRDIFEETESQVL